MEAIDAAAKQVQAGEAKDPSTVARNLATVAGIQTDKALLTEGRPTVVVGNDVQSLIARMAKLLGHEPPPRPIDGTAEEYEPLMPRELEPEPG